MRKFYRKIYVTAIFPSILCTESHLAANVIIAAEVFLISYYK